MPFGNIDYLGADAWGVHSEFMSALNLRMLKLRERMVTAFSLSQKGIVVPRARTLGGLLSQRGSMMARAATCRKPCPETKTWTDCSPPSLTVATRVMERQRRHVKLPAAVLSSQNVGSVVSSARTAMISRSFDGLPAKANFTSIPSEQAQKRRSDTKCSFGASSAKIARAPGHRSTTDRTCSRPSVACRSPRARVAKRRRSVYP